MGVMDMGRKNKNRQRREKKKSKQNKAIQEAIVKVENADSKKATFPKLKSVKRKYRCHNGFVEVVNGLFVGSRHDLKDEIIEKIDILVPLNDLDGDIWEKGFKGKIDYIPIEDYHILPYECEKMLATRVAGYVKDGLKVAIFCLGGHGRTGYFASLVLHELGIKNPVGFLKKNYCNNVVESKAQYQAIAEYTNDKNVVDEYYEPRYFDTWFDNLDYWDYSSYSVYKNKCKSSYKNKNYYEEVFCKGTCGNCSELVDGYCYYKGEFRKIDDVACGNYITY